MHATAAAAQQKLFNAVWYSAEPANQGAGLMLG
jgi:hypothetical protein